jgi:hypothetical protein
MWCAYVESSPPRLRRNGKTCSLITSYISAGAMFLNRDQRRSSKGRVARMRQGPSVRYVFCSAYQF